MKVLTGVLLIGTGCLCAAPAAAQTFGVHTGGSPDVVIKDVPPEWLAASFKDPNSPEMQKFREARQRELSLQKELKKIRFQHFRTKRTEERQEGLIKLKAYADPKNFETLVKFFEPEGEDVVVWMLDVFADATCHEGDTCIAWLSVYGREKSTREQASRRVARRMRELGELPEGMGMAIYSGLRSGESTPMSAAANLVDQFDIISAIPWLISAQVGSRGGAGGGSIDRGSSGDLAWIAVGTQQAFVSDLTPVVGPNAVAFDPQLDVVTSGTVLRISDAVVYEYHYEIHVPLTRLTSRLTDTDTSPLGWDAEKWTRWYTKEFPGLRELKLAGRRP